MIKRVVACAIGLLALLTFVPGTTEGATCVYLPTLNRSGCALSLPERLPLPTLAP